MAVIPAQAGIQSFVGESPIVYKNGFRLRGNDGA